MVHVWSEQLHVPFSWETPLYIDQPTSRKPVLEWKRRSSSTVQEAICCSRPVGSQREAEHVCCFSFFCFTVSKWISMWKSMDITLISIYGRGIDLPSDISNSLRFMLRRSLQEIIVSFTCLIMIDFHHWFPERSAFLQLHSGTRPRKPSVRFDRRLSFFQLWELQTCKTKITQGGIQETIPVHVYNIYIYIFIYTCIYIYIYIHIYMYTVYMYTHVYLQTEQDGYIILGMLSRWDNWTWRLWQQDLLRCSGYKILVILDRVCVYIVHIWVNYNNSLTWKKVI